MHCCCYCCCLVVIVIHILSADCICRQLVTRLGIIFLCCMRRDGFGKHLDNMSCLKAALGRSSCNCYAIYAENFVCRICIKYQHLRTINLLEASANLRNRQVAVKMRLNKNRNGSSRCQEAAWPKNWRKTRGDRFKDKTLVIRNRVQYSVRCASFLFSFLSLFLHLKVQGTMYFLNPFC